jgi:hypothetical protein
MQRRASDNNIFMIPLYGLHPMWNWVDYVPNSWRVPQLNHPLYQAHVVKGFAQSVNQVALQSPPVKEFNVIKSLLERLSDIGDFISGFSQHTEAPQELITPGQKVVPSTTVVQQGTTPEVFT